MFAVLTVQIRVEDSAELQDRIEELEIWVIVLI